MRYREPVFRPPSEAESYLLPVTDGCSHNECTYCAMYRTKRFSVRPEADILEDIRLAARAYPDTRRVFLLDGDALTLAPKRLVPVLEALRAAFPELQRVSSYANAVSILNKTDAELAQLRALGLSLGYLGLESGDEAVNASIVKGATIDEQVEAVQRAQAAGIKMSVMVLLGMGGAERSREHAIATGQVLSRMDPRYISCLCVTPVPGTELFDAVEAGTFRMITPEQTLVELALLLEHTDVSGAVFRSNHASNYLPLGGRLPADKARLLAAVDAARRGEVALKPEYLRGL
ncbi:MAG: radical SAM protein [Planctomycetota bacterium]|nr:radical SAM protein [Planctomycetota bacterium]